MSLFNGNALLAGLLAAIVAFLGYGKAQHWMGQRAGEQAAVAEMEKKDNAAAQKISEAGKRSDRVAPGRVRRLVRDPNAVSE